MAVLGIGQDLGSVQPPPPKIFMELKDRIAEKSLTPVTILSGTITTDKEYRLDISAMLHVEFTFIGGFAIYVNGVAQGVSGLPNNTHPDHVAIVHRVNAATCPDIYALKVVTDILPPGEHNVEIAVNSLWSSSPRAFVVNSRSSNDMGSSSYATVEAF